MDIIGLISKWLGYKTSHMGKSYKQVDLARDAGISPSYMSKIMTGNRNAGNLTVKRIARALGVSVSDFYKGPPSEPESVRDHELDPTRDLPLQGTISAGTPGEHARSDEKIRHEIAGLLINVRGEKLRAIRELVRVCAEESGDAKKNIRTG